MLYKYLSPDRIDVLENCHIRFTQSAAFNDPFEIKPHIHSIAPEDELRRQLREMLPESLRQEYLKLPLQAQALLPYEQFLVFANMQMESAMPIFLAWGNFVAKTIIGELQNKGVCIDTFIKIPVKPRLTVRMFAGTVSG